MLLSKAHIQVAGKRDFLKYSRSSCLPDSEWLTRTLMKDALLVQLTGAPGTGRGCYAACPT